MIAYAPYLLLLFPLCAAVAIRLFLHPFPRIAIAISTGACGLSFLGSLFLLWAGGTSADFVVAGVSGIESAGLEANWVD